MPRAIIIIAIVLLASWKIRGAWSRTGGDEFPSRPIHVVVPYTAGGETDTLARIVQEAVTTGRLLPQTLVIQNQPGGSGTIGSRYVKNAPPDGYTVLCHHESIITANVSGTVAFGPEAFVPIAQTGNKVLLIIVREDAPYETVIDLLEKAKANPATVNFGANVGSPGHFAGMQLQEAFPGANLNFITSGGGQKRFTQLIGGHLQAGIFSLAEYRAFRAANDTPPDRNIRALAILETERHPEIPDVPTVREAGLEVSSSNANYWWAPKDTPPDVVSTLADALEGAMASPEVQARFGELAIGPIFRRGEKLAAHLEERVANISQFDVRSETRLPDFPLYIAIIVAVLAVTVGTTSLRETRHKPHGERASPAAVRKALLCVLVLTAYIGALHTGSVPYFLATAAMIFLTAATITNWSRLAPITLMALLVSLGSEFIFTEIFAVPLP